MNWTWSLLVAWQATAPLAGLFLASAVARSVLDARRDERAARRAASMRRHPSYVAPEES